MNAFHSLAIIYCRSFKIVYITFIHICWENGKEKQQLLGQLRLPLTEQSAKVSFFVIFITLFVDTWRRFDSCRLIYVTGNAITK